jgi:hypothetical protein
VQKEALPPGIVKAALAFSALSTFQADSISGRLRPRDRARLRAGLVHVRGATANERRNALQKLVVATRHGPDWKTPVAHDPVDCPFRCVETHTASDVAHTFEKIAARRPLHVAVALSHMEPHVRDAIWEQLPMHTRGDVVDILSDVATVSPGRTRFYARELRATLEPE